MVLENEHTRIVIINLLLFILMFIVTYHNMVFNPPKKKFLNSRINKTKLEPNKTNLKTKILLIWNTFIHDYWNENQFWAWS